MDEYLISERTGEVQTLHEWIVDAKLQGWDLSKEILTPVVPDGNGGWVDKD